MRRNENVIKLSQSFVQWDSICILGTMCGCAQPRRSEMSPRSMHRTMSFSCSFWRKSQWSSVSWSNSCPTSQSKQWKYVSWLVCVWWLRKMSFDRIVTLLPKSPVWNDNDCTGSEDASSLKYYECHVDNLAFEVVDYSWERSCSDRWRLNYFFAIRDRDLYRVYESADLWNKDLSLKHMIMRFVLRQSPHGNGCSFVISGLLIRYIRRYLTRAPKGQILDHLLTSSQTSQ